jgi:thiaminase/transcriptional activator TenA
MSFCQELRRRHDALWEANYRHPFVQGIGRGDLAADAYRFFLEQDYLYLIESCRFLGLAAARAPDLAVMGTFATLLKETLDVEMDLHRRTCAKLGVTAEDLERVEPAPACLGYTSWLLATAANGTALDCVAALLPCYWGYSEIGIRLKERGVPEHEDYRDWIETYASDEFARLAGWCRDWVDARAPSLSDDDSAKVDGLFRTAGRWEHAFWEMAWRREDWAV